MCRAQLLVCLLSLLTICTIPDYLATYRGSLPLSNFSKAQQCPRRSKKESYSPLTFVKERLHIQLSSSEGIVKGWYYIRNELPQSQEVLLYYPFAVNEYQGPPFEVEINEPVIKKDTQGFSFLVRLGPCRAHWVRVSYKQPLYGEQFTYILTTTARWGRALEQASFRIGVPADWGDVSLSYPADRVHVQGAWKIYTIKRRDFLPDRDLCIHRDIPSERRRDLQCSGESGF